MCADYGRDTRSLAEIYSDVSANVQFPMAKLLLEKMDAQSITTGLDVGCGTGDAIIHLAESLADLGKEGYSLHGIDPLLDRIDIAKESLAKANKRRRSESKPDVKVDFQVAGAEKVLELFGKDRFDLIFLNATIHWIPDKPDALSQFRAALKDTGKLGYTTPSGEHDVGLKIPKEICSKPPYNAYPYEPIIRLMTPDQWRALTIEAKFQVDFLEAINWPLTFRSYQEFELHMASSSYGNFGRFPQLPHDLERRAGEEMKEKIIENFSGKGSEIVIPLYQIFLVASKS